MLRLAHYCACVRASRRAWGRWGRWVCSRRIERHDFASLMRAAPSLLASPFARLHRRLLRERASAWQQGRAPYFVRARVRSLERSLRRAWRRWYLGASTHARAVVGALRARRTRLAAAWHHWGPWAAAFGSSSRWRWRKVRATLEGALSDWCAWSAVRSASQATLEYANARWGRVSRERSLRRSVGRLDAWFSRSSMRRSLLVREARWRERSVRQALLTWDVAVQAAAKRCCDTHVATRAREGRNCLSARVAIRTWATVALWNGPARGGDLLATALAHARHVDTARATRHWRMACAAHGQIEERRVVLSKVEEACREARGHRESLRLQLSAQRALSRWHQVAQRRLRFATWRQLQKRFAPVAKSRQPRHAQYSAMPAQYSAMHAQAIPLPSALSTARAPLRPPASPTAPPAPPTAHASDAVPLMPSCAQYGAPPGVLSDEVLRATLDQLRLDLYHPRAWDTDGVYHPRARLAQQLAALGSLKGPLGTALGSLEGPRCPNQGISRESRASARDGARESRGSAALRCPTHTDPHRP